MPSRLHTQTKAALSKLQRGAALLLLLCHGSRAAEAGAFSPSDLEFYEKQVQPILADNCYKCHSHEADKIKGEFVLDSREGLLKGGETGPAIVPGDPEKSLMIKAVRHVDDDLKMPPKQKLAAEQIAILTDWVKRGAPYAENSAVAKKIPKVRKITDEDRRWWAFQPVKRSMPPDEAPPSESKNPIDRFVFAKLKEAGMAPASRADKRTLIRRLYFDLIGLPPTVEQVENFLRDGSPDAYDKLVDKLLADSRYGEKWARHWLDLVRYAESDGYKSDSYRPNAWRYRDYVVKSFNQDKPYNRFLMEQIAADELWPDDPESLIGVSYLRLGIYEYNQRNVKAQWATILNDITDVTGDAMLGLGMQCARCHDHKFDPILQRDYYRLQAFFAAILPREKAVLATPEERKAYAGRMADWEKETAEVRAQIEAVERPVREKSAKAVIDKLPKDIQAIMYKPEVERTPYEQQIRDLAYRQVTEEEDKLDGKFKGHDKEKLEELRAELAKFEPDKPKPLPDAMLVSDSGPSAPALWIPKDKLQIPIEPGILTLLDPKPAVVEPTAEAPQSTGRRATLARWLGDAKNPLTPRVMVNRLWQQHFGRGLVGTPSDFGHLGEKPSHAELLDFLADYLVEHRWSLKQIHRLIVTSSTYCQASVTAEQANDPDNRLLWRQAVRRLDNDQIRDAMLAVTGELEMKAGGPSVEPTKPQRTIYTKWLRNSRDPILEAFDPPDAYTSTPQRNITTTPMQSLVMINGPYVLQRAQSLAARIRKLEQADNAGRIKAAYRLVYQREPASKELARGMEFLHKQSQELAKNHKQLAQLIVTNMPSRTGTAAVFLTDKGQTRLQIPDNHLLPQYDFTLEAYVVLRSADEGGATRTLISRWDGRENQPGWALGVAGMKTGAHPRTLVLELIGDTAEDGTGGYEKIASDLALELNVPYFVAVSVRLEDTSESGITFYAKALTGEGAWHMARAAHRVTANHQSNLPVIIGARDPEKHLVWDGLIDDVRVSRQALKREELLASRDSTLESTVGFWRFESPDYLKDSSPNGNNIRPDVSPAAASDSDLAALVDFCHVLLNSNEFLYVD